MLRRHHEKRAKDFAEAQEISTRLMAVIGLKQPKAASDELQTGTALQDLGTQGEHLPCNPDSIAAATQSFGSSTSTTSGPTPKRTKTHQRFKPLDSRRANAVFNTTNRKASRNNTVKERRCPLMNLSHVTRNVGISTPSQPLCQSRDRIQENDEASKENKDMDCIDNPYDKSFDDSDMFTGMYQHSLNGRGDTTASEALDDATMDI